jgi:peroxiredoxin Q/BCP
MSSPGVGDIAPDFTLTGTDGIFHLSDHRGRTVVLAFYPGDDTKVCTKQMCAYSDDRDAFEDLDAVVVGISAKDVESKQRFAEKRAIGIPLLADPARKVARLYGAKTPILGTARATFVIDADGVIRFHHDAFLGLSYLSPEDLRAASRRPETGGTSVRRAG